MNILMPNNVDEDDIIVKKDGTTLNKTSQWTTVNGRTVRIPGITVGSAAVSITVEGQEISSGSPDAPVIEMLNSGVNGYGALATGRFDLYWKPVAGVLNYQISRSTSQGGTYITLATIKDTSYPDVTASLNTSYYYKVTAVGAFGNASSLAYGPVRANFSYGFDYSDTIGQPPNSSIWSIDSGSLLVAPDSL